jgi:hypothetical protein
VGREREMGRERRKGERSHADMMKRLGCFGDETK